ncbi:MAG: PorT family protein [Bacteroidetes bacterium]|nr:MAG: PorT family protein [Bacteroidota bacterium]
MKKYLAIILISFATIQVAQSQILISLLFGDKLNTGKIEFGLSGGLNLTYLRGISESRGQQNWALGFYFDFLLKEKSPWYIATGVYVKSNVGARNIPLDYPGNRTINDSIYTGFVNFNGTVEKQFNTFYVPINLRYMTKSGIFIEGGAQIGLVFKTRDIYTANVDDNKLEYKVIKGVVNNGLYKWFDGGVDAGVGYKTKKGWKIGVWYYVGLTNIYKNDFDFKAYNSSLYVLATIPIGKKKAEKARAAKEAEMNK